MGSMRMPEKTMKMVGNHPLLQYCVDRTRMALKVDRVVVATTINPRDDVISDWCTGEGVLFSRGSENDVLDRYYQAARDFEASLVVRVTADCPLVDPGVIDLLIESQQETGADYVSNRLAARTWPHGLDVEVMKFSALERAWKEATDPFEHEHVTPYILRHPDIFSLHEVPYPKNYSFIRITVDYPEDMELIRILIDDYQAHTLDTESIISLFTDHPELLAINKNRNDNH